MSKNNDAQHDEHRPNVGLYVKVFLALMVLTLITVAISKVHLPRPQAVALGLFVAAIKASLVGALFMHLWGENKLIHRALWLTIGGALILVLPMLDFVMISSRITSPADVAAQHPGGHGSEHPESVTESVELEAPAAPKKGR
ncbi:MAG: cytochrome C oxidase subunit IV family protein [Elusimicrobia bacterium]|nr:cytochrome C oxidase subunit IV family protein [Elusimicrobiota bacterium]